MGRNIPDIYALTRIGIVVFLIFVVVITLWAVYDWDKNSNREKNYAEHWMFCLPHFFLQRG